MINEHRAEKYDHSDLLWELINFELWCIIYLDQREAQFVI